MGSTKTCLGISRHEMGKWAVREKRIKCRSNVFQVKGVSKISAPENTLSMIKIPYRAGTHPDGVSWITRNQLRGLCGTMAANLQRYGTWEGSTHKCQIIYYFKF